jgi:hypothetical protein
MKSVVLLVVVLLGLLAFSESLPLKMKNNKPFVLSPFGLVPLSCVTELPTTGAHISKTSTGQTQVDIHSPFTDEITDSYQIPPCPEQVITRAFPSDYDGWLAYTSYNNVETFDEFLGYFSVPPTPVSTPDVLYVFTGLQNVDWIPKVDPIPPRFDIIQPVLQYPGDFGNYWSVKSWYVTVDAGVQVTKELKLEVGDNVFGNMTRTGPESWYIGSTSTMTNQSVGLTATHPVLKSQPWAYTTVECYGCSGCDTEPTSPIAFTYMYLSANSEPVTPQWQAFQSPTPICDTTAVIVSPSTVDFTFGASN